MFKWLLPAGQVSKQPLKVRFDGVPAGSPEAHALGQALNPQINHFLKKNAQNRGDLPVYGSHTQYPDLWMRYFYNNGQETLTILVSTELRHEIAKRHPKDYWRFAIIELYVPDTHFDLGAVRLFCWAHLASPNEQDLDPTLVAPVLGLAPNGSGGEFLDPIINFAEPALAQDVPNGADTFSDFASFTVDLRPIPGITPVSVDLHPYIFVQEQDFSGTTIMFTDLVTIEDVPPPLNPYDNIQGYIYSGQAAVHPPAIYFNAVDGEWQFVGYDSKQIMVFVGTTISLVAGPFGPDGVIYPAGTTYYWWHQFNVYDGDVVSPYSGPNPVPAEVRVIMFKDVPNVEIVNMLPSEFSGGRQLGYTRWTLKGKYPNVPAYQKIADTAVPVYNATNYPGLPATPLIGNIFNLDKIGTVQLDAEHGVGTWQPA